MIDSHCHLTATEFDLDCEEVLARAKQAGITHCITICDELGDVEKCKKLVEKYENILYTVGVHPHHAATFNMTTDVPFLRQSASHPSCKGIGEIGLDYYYMRSEKDVQQRVFEAQLLLAKELHLPAVVHCRDAVEDLWTIVNHVQPSTLVIHCCTEKWIDIKRFVEAGYFLSFTGIVTYPKALDVQETARLCPLDQMMIETDAPYLAPVPHRGKRCEPMFVAEVAKKIAELKGVDLTEVDGSTTQNARKFFDF